MRKEQLGISEMKNLLLLLPIFAIVAGSPCTDYTHATYGKVGECILDSCCKGGGYISNLCPNDPNNIKCCFTGSSCTGTNECPGVTIVSRAEWGAAPPKSISTIPVPVSKVFIHHTEGSSCTTNCASAIRNTQNYHMNDPSRNYADIGYNFLVGGDGKIYEGRGWNREGAHTRGYNRLGIAISYVGSYLTNPPSAAMLTAAQNLIACGVSKGYISSSYTLHGHRDANCTNCPGDALYNIIKGWANFQGKTGISYTCKK